MILEDESFALLLLDVFIEHIPVMLSVTDATGKVIWINREVERVLGWSPGDVQQVDIIALSHPNPTDRGEVLQWAREGRGWRDFRTLRKDGTTVDTAWEVVRLPDGKLLGIGLETTERRSTERELMASREQIRRLAARTAARVERERSELARELHDELGQILTGLKMDLSYLNERLQGQPPELLAKGVEIVAAVDGLFRMVRRVSASLRPHVLDRLGLLEAIEWQTREFERHGGVRCKLKTRLQAVNLEPQRAIHVFRIVQEALTNAMRHARPTRVTVRATERRQVLAVTVRDNGCGISKSALADPEALGLVGMQERALLIGGSVTVARGPRKGTTVTVTVPLRPTSGTPATRPRKREPRKGRNPKTGDKVDVPPKKVRRAAEGRGR